MTKRVYSFGTGTVDGSRELLHLLGGKGANLAEMTRLGLPVPPGFTLTTATCMEYFAYGNEWPPGLEREVRSAFGRLETALGAGFGDATNPLLVSVRSGAGVSMPGMMDTILNVGLNDATVQGLATKTGALRSAYDSYRRLLHMYGNVVLNVPHAQFEDALDGLKQQRGVEADTGLDTDDLRELVQQYKQLIVDHAGAAFPDDPYEQLRGAVDAVFRSWHNSRAARYRQLHGIPHDGGTAVNVQAMVFGNMGDTSGTGVAFTRNPSTGTNELFGEFLTNAQGEDVVAGWRTPESISRLRRLMPAVYEQLTTIARQLEQHYRDVQDIEFTVQEGKLFMLQTRSAKRTGPAAVRIAVEMVSEGLIDEQTALGRVAPEQLEQLLHKQIDPDAAVEIVARGLPASPGAAVGKAVFTAEVAEQRAAAGETVILVRRETSPEDIGGMNAAAGILTSRGGMTSHAAVVARAMGKCCVTGAADVIVDETSGRFVVGRRTFHEGDWLTIDGGAGVVAAGRARLVDPVLTDQFWHLMRWAEDSATLTVRANADTAAEAIAARRFGARGIGLCRTEHMFFGDERIQAMRALILAGDGQARKAALQTLLPFQRADFYDILKAMNGLPVTVRLLDPPLHEFLPKDDATMVAVAQRMDVDAEYVRNKVAALHEYNPMLGHRGCRLALTFPEIYAMQTRAVMEAAVQLKTEGGDPKPEIMIPLVGTAAELGVLRELVTGAAEAVFLERGVSVDYLVGTMIEVPRAALVAESIAREADFFSFGTNDLTQLTFGFSRDDSGTFLPAYVERGILPDDPFQTLDETGVGELIAMGCERGRRGNAGIAVGICGEHGGDPRSIAFCHQVGLDYVSCSPFRVPVALLAAARAQVAAPR